MEIECFIVYLLAYISKSYTYWTYYAIIKNERYFLNTMFSLYKLHITVQKFKPNAKESADQTSYFRSLESIVLFKLNCKRNSN